MMQCKVFLQALLLAITILISGIPAWADTDANTDANSAPVTDLPVLISEQNSTSAVSKTNALTNTDSLSKSNNIADTNPKKPALDPIVSRGSIIRMLLSLAFILALIYGGAWLFRRSQLNALLPGQSLRVVAALSVGAREKVVLVQVGEQQVLIGVAPGRVNLLQNYETAVLPQDASGVKNSGLAGEFTKILKDTVNKPSDTKAGPR